MIKPRFWARKRFWASMLASLPVLMVFRVWMQCVPEPGRIAEIDRRVQRAIVTRYGPDVTTALANLDRSEPACQLQDFLAIPLGPLAWSPSAVVAAGSSAVAARMRKADLRFRDYATSYSAVSGSGGVYPFLHRPAASDGVRDLPQQLALLNVRWLHIASMTARLHDEDWNGALAAFESAAHASDAFRSAGVSGIMEAARGRIQCYQAAEALLRARPDAARSRQALALLRSLQDTDPVVSPEFAVGNLLDSTDWQQFAGHTGFARFFYADTLLLGNALHGVARDIVASPGSETARQWASGTVLPHSPGTLAAPLPWTRTASLMIQLRRILKRNPDLLPSELGTNPVYAGTDVLARALFLYQSGPDNLFGAQELCVDAALQGRLIEAAFAARVYREEHGTWPDDVGALIAPGETGAESQSRDYSPISGSFSELKMQDVKTVLGVESLAGGNLDIHSVAVQKGPLSPEIQASESGGRRVNTTIPLDLDRIDLLFPVTEYLEGLREFNTSVSLGIRKVTVYNYSGPSSVMPAPAEQSLTRAAAESFFARYADKALAFEGAATSPIALRRGFSHSDAPVRAEDGYVRFMIHCEARLPENIFMVFARHPRTEALGPYGHAHIGGKEVRLWKDGKFDFDALAALPARAPEQYLYVPE